MAIVNKPILLDETGKDIASAVREQTQALQTAIQSISVGGGSGGDDGYFPTNVMGLTMGSSVSTEIGITYLKVYDPSTSDFPPPKYILIMAMEESDIYVVSPVATEEELSQWDGNFAGDIAASSFVLNTTSVFGMITQVGTFPVPKADNKPLWVGVTQDLSIMPMYGFY